jgi:hypothetical protein
MMGNRLSRIDEALSRVEEARTRCPFHNTYTGREVHGVNDACRACGKRRNGDGGRCTIERAEHEAILAIEEVMA